MGRREVLNIAAYGYVYNGDPTKEHSIVVVPLYPLTCRLCHEVAGVLIPRGAFVLSNVPFFRLGDALDVLVIQEIRPGAARCAILWLACFPSSLFCSTMYTESFPVLFSMLAYHCFREQRFIVGACGSAWLPPRGHRISSSASRCSWQGSRI